MKPLPCFFIFLLLIGVSCSKSEKSNPVVYFEIPVNDLERAEKFYSAVFNFNFDKEIIDGNEMVLFPFEEKNSGITGALARGEGLQTF